MVYMVWHWVVGVMPGPRVSVVSAHLLNSGSSQLIWRGSLRPV